MSYVMIGIHYVGDDIVGFRIYNRLDKVYTDAKIESVIKAINQGVEIENIEISNNKIVGSNGSLERYTKLINKKLSGVSKIVIMSIIDDNIYRIVNYNGIEEVTYEKELIIQSQYEGLANGKIVDRDGKKFISAIRGEYRREVASKSAEKRVSVLKALKKGDMKESIPEEMTILKDYINRDQVIEYGVKTIGERLYCDNSWVRSVKIESSVKVIKAKAFMNAKNLSAIVIDKGKGKDDGLERIEMCAFFGTKLRSIELPPTVRYVGKNALKIITLNELIVGYRALDLSEAGVPLKTKIRYIN